MVTRLPHTDASPAAGEPVLGGAVGGGMKIDEQHVAEPGLVALDIIAADEDTVRTVMDGLQQQWATSGITPVWRTPGEVGVKARVYADVRRQPDPAD